MSGFDTGVITAAAVIAGVYLAATLFLARGLLRKSKPAGKPVGFFSVVIAARNEEHNIAACLASIFSQDLPENRFEVIVVNDRSTDATDAIMRDLMTRHENLRLLTITETPVGMSPKKHAVSCGVEIARGEIVVFTDADCRVPVSWLSSIEKEFESGTGMVQGITLYEKDHSVDSVLWHVQAVDFLSHGIVSAAGIGAGLPINSNANNFAFRKEAFLAVGGFGSASGVISGDDDLLMQRIWRSGNYCVRYMLHAGGAVTTAPSQTLAAVLEQRKRWASKTVHYQPLQAAYLGCIFLFYMMIPCLLIGGLFSRTLLLAGLAAYAIKPVGEFFLMIPGTRLFGAKALRPWILPASLIHLWMVLYAVFFGVFGKFEWKGERFGRVAK